MITKARSFWSQINTFPKMSPDEVRRGRLLNIILTGSFVLCLLSAVIISVILYLTSDWDAAENRLLIAILSIGMTGSLLLLVVNQFSVRYASALFLVLLTVALTFSDYPAEVANGRSSFVFFTPIAVSSLLLTDVTH